MRSKTHNKKPRFYETNPFSYGPPPAAAPNEPNLPLAGTSPSSHHRPIEGTEKDNSMKVLRSFQTRHTRDPETGDQIFTVSACDEADTETRIAAITVHDDAYIFGATFSPHGPCIVVRHEDAFLTRSGEDGALLEAILGAMPPE
jgi:hypothetical protein